MRLLILTQTVNREDATLGFFHGWISALSTRFEKITVFALRVGVHDLPKNIEVISMRPWLYRARLRTACRVLVQTWKYRHEYDAVFVHMNQEYLLVSGWLWRLMGKRVYFWRNHYDGSILTDIAVSFCNKVFYTSKSSYTAKYARAVQMPVGVDKSTCHLEDVIDRNERSILFLGRFSSAKRPDLLVEALGILYKKNISFTATFVGGAGEAEPSFPEKVRAQAEDLDLSERVTFVGAVPNTETYRYYRSHKIYVNCARSGMLDKSLFKAIACGCLPIFVSRDMADMVGEDYLFSEGDAGSLATCLEKALDLSEEDRTAQVEIFHGKTVNANSLPVLVDRLTQEITA